MDDLHKARHWVCNKKEIARALTQPTTADQQKLKHLLRYIKGTQHYKQYVRPTTKTPTAEAAPDIQVFVDSDWAGCATTRKSTTGFLIKVFGATIHYGSRTQVKINTTNNPADILTKYVATETLLRHISDVGINTQHH